MIPRAYTDYIQGLETFIISENTHCTSRLKIYGAQKETAHCILKTTPILEMIVNLDFILRESFVLVNKL